MYLRKLAVLTALLLLCGCAARAPEPSAAVPEQSAPVSGDFSDDVDASAPFAEDSAAAPGQSAPAAEGSAQNPDGSASAAEQSAPAPDVSSRSAEESAAIAEESAQNADNIQQTAEENAEQPAAAAPVTAEGSDQTAAAAPASAEGTAETAAAAPASAEGTAETAAAAPVSAEETAETAAAAPASAEGTAETAAAAPASAEGTAETAAAAPASAEEPAAIPETWDSATTYHRTLCFTGDINLAEGQYTTAALDSDGLKKCVGKRLRRAMRKADLLCVNNEFAYTNRGTPLEGKAFTFRADPSRTAVLKKLGADAAIVANNHVFDYCEEGLTDTLDALSQAGIDAVGAGRNLKEASAVHYYDLDGCKVALLAASRVEWSAQTRPATKDGMGVFYTAYDTDLLYRQVKRAKKKADFVVVCMHWGMEGTADLEEYQTEVGEGLVKAGADLVVGDHPHQLQGVKIVKDTPVYYSLGNFWFNRREEYTMLLRVRLSGDKYGLREVRTQVLPAWQGGAKVKALSGDEGQAMFDYLAGLPGSNIQVDEKGYVTKKGK